MNKVGFIVGGGQLVSVIIPVYNQYSSLLKVLNAFCMQTVNMNNVELIIVDDGSTDKLSEKFNVNSIESNMINYKIIHQYNQGRAAARNTGVKNSVGDIIIFCDADRIPKDNFIEQHLKFHQRGENIVVGASYDYFGKNEYISENGVNWDAVNKFSRIPYYLKTISAIYDEKGYSESKIVWLSFLVGNASVKREVIESMNGFDEEFKEWGFEHFELAYRMWSRRYKFSLNRQAINYHIPHARAERFYIHAIEKSAELMVNKHPEINRNVLTQFVNGKIDISLAEETMYEGEQQ